MQTCSRMHAWRPAAGCRHAGLRPDALLCFAPPLRLHRCVVQAETEAATRVAAARRAAHAAVADFAGGELRFYEQRKHGDRGEVVLPTRGTVELFSSGWENMHEVSKLVSENVRKHASKLSIPRVVIPRPACYKDSTMPPLHDPTLDLRTYLRLNRWRASLRGSATRSPYSSPRSNLQRPHRGEAREARARTTAQHAPPRCLSLAMSETRPIRDSIWPASAARTAEEQAGRRMG